MSRTRGIHVPPLHSHPIVTHMTSEQDWVRAVDEAATLADLRELTLAWEPFVPDAKAVAYGMTEDDWLAFRLGLSLERKAQFAGAEWAARFGYILQPAVLGDATLMALNLHVPLGTVLLRAGPTLLAERGW